MYDLNFTGIVGDSLPVSQIYDAGALNTPGLNITSFDIAATETSAIRELFISDDNNLLFLLAVDSSDYTKYNYSS